MEGYIEGYYVDKRGSKPLIFVFVRYVDNIPLFVPQNLQQISKAGKRIYFTVNQLYKYRKNIKFGLISTNKGLITLEQAYVLQLGGELLFIITI